MPLNNIFKQKKKKCAPKSKKQIIIDFREKNSLVPTYLRKEDFKITFKELKIGDYIVGNTIIERKEAKDFVQSIFNKRLFKQMEEITQTAHHLLLVEGELENKNSIKGALLSIALKYHIPILYSKNPKESAEFISLLAKKETKPKNLRAHKKSKTLNEELIYILEGFPKIGPSTAKRLLKKFKSIKNIIQAKDEEIEPILKSKTLKFIKTINSKYTSE